MAHQFLDSLNYQDDSNDNQDFKQLKNNLKDILKQDLISVGRKNLDIIDQKGWKYFAHWQMSSIDKFYPWIVKDKMQGKYNNTYYIGSFVSFESMQCIVE